MTVFDLDAIALGLGVRRDTRYPKQVHRVSRSGLGHRGPVYGALSMLPPARNGGVKCAPTQLAHATDSPNP